MTDPRTLFIAGASTRAAAYSALRAGLKPLCADLFADRDLKAVAEVRRISLDPPTLDIAANLPASARWIYTGPFENYPGLVDQIRSTLPLWGTCGANLKAARDPVRLARSLKRAGLSTPELRPDPAGLPRDGSWLMKPIASGGGRNIEPWAAWSRLSDDPVYFQERIPGPSYSALYLGSLGRAALIGISRQLLGLGGQPFAYRGGIGPVRLPRSFEAQLARIGDRLADEFRLIGLFGVDFIAHAGRAWVLELNPRYTASVEILELASRSPLLLEHGRVCDIDMSGEGGTGVEDCRGEPCRIVGKRILYATRRLTAPDLSIQPFVKDDPYRVPEIADVPDEGTEIEIGEPVLTVFAEGNRPGDCAARLRLDVNRWRRRLGLV